MIMTKELAILKAKEQFDEMIEMIRQAAMEGWMINEVEGDIWKRLLKTGCLTLEGYVDLQGSGDLVCIIDIYYVLQRLWDAAHCFWPEGSQEARDFVTERLERILEGKVGRVIGGLKQMGTKHKQSYSRRKQLCEAIGYLDRNRSLMKYD